MISSKSRIKQLHTEKRASIGILTSLGELLSAQLTGTIHPLISIGDVNKTLTEVAEAARIVDTLCARVGNDPDTANDETILALLGSAEGEQMARQFVRLKRFAETRVFSWDEGRDLGRAQIETYEPTPLVVHDRGVAFEYHAFLRHTEAVYETFNALLGANQLQFWVGPDGKYQYTGQPDESGE